MIIPRCRLAAVPRRCAVIPIAASFLLLPPTGVEPTLWDWKAAGVSVAISLSAQRWPRGTALAQSLLLLYLVARPTGGLSSTIVEGLTLLASVS